MDFRAVICGPVACHCHACWRWVAAAISVCMRVDGLGLESVDRLLVWLYASVAFTNNYRLCRRSGCQLGKITVFRQAKLFLSELEDTPWSWFVVQCGQSPFSTRSQQHPLGAWHLACALFPTKHFFSVIKRLVCLEHMETSCDFGHEPLWPRQGRDTTGRAAKKSLGHRLRVERSKPAAWCFAGGRRCPSQNDCLY
jgi:hypothetical protein